MRVFWLFLLGGLTLLQRKVTGNAVAEPSVDNGELLRRLKVVEERGLQQDLVIRQLLSTVDKQNDMLKEQQEAIERQKFEIGELKQALGETRPSKEEQSEPLDDKSTSTSIRAHSRSNNGISTSKRLVLGETDGPIAFHARIDKGAIEHISLTQKIVFDITVLNIGGGYHNSSGIFTAPVQGLYFFSLSVCILHTGKDIHAEITKNGASVAGSYANGNDQGSISVLVPLVAGDEVWVSSLYHPDTYLWGDTLTSFMGYIIADY